MGAEAGRRVVRPTTGGKTKGQRRLHAWTAGTSWQEETHHGRTYLSLGDRGRRRPNGLRRHGGAVLAARAPHPHGRGDWLVPNRYLHGHDHRLSGHGCDLDALGLSLGPVRPPARGADRSGPFRAEPLAREPRTF